jgi:hypothetical protein
MYTSKFEIHVQALQLYFAIKKRMFFFCLFVFSFFYTTLYIFSLYVYIEPEDTP